MADRRGPAAAASTHAEPSSSLPVHNTDDVTVEYIKENDFGPHRVKKYSPRSLGRPKRATGKGYYVTHESESFVRKVVQKAAAATQKKDPARTQSTRTRRSVGGNAGTDSNDGPGTPKSTKSEQAKEPQGEVSTPPAQISQKETSVKSTPCKVDPPKPVAVPATNTSTKPDTPTPDTPEAASVSKPRARARSIQLPTAMRAAPHKPNVTPKSSNLVADTISSLVSLFGERRKLQGGGAAARPAAARTPNPDSAIKVEATTPTMKKRVGRSAVTPPTKSLTEYQTNDVVKRTAAIATSEVQIKSSVSQAVPALPAATNTPGSTGGRVARKRVGTTPDTKKPVGSTTRSATTTTPPNGEVRKPVETTATSENQAVKQTTTTVSATESLTSALSNVVNKTIGAAKTSIEKRSVSKGRAAATAVPPAKQVENSADEEADMTVATKADVEDKVAPSAPTATAARRRGRAAGRSNNIVGVTVTPAKSVDNSADQEDLIMIGARANKEDQSDPARPPVGKKAPKKGKLNVPAMAVGPSKIVNSEDVMTVSLEKTVESSSDNIVQKISTVSTEDQIEPPTTATHATTTTKRGRGRSAATKTKMAVAETAATLAKMIEDSVPPETSATMDNRLAVPDTTPTTVATRRRGNSGKRKASPEKETPTEGKQSARSVNLAKRVAAKASKGNARKRARITANVAEYGAPVEQEVQPPTTVDMAPVDEAPPPAAVDATDSNSRISQALMMIQATVSQEVGKLVQSDTKTSISSNLKEKIINKVNRKSSPSQLQQSPEEELDESSEEVTGKGTNAQKKRRVRKPVNIVKTFPLRSRRRIESDPEEEEDISDHGDEEQESQAPNVKMAISVQKRTLVQNDSNRAAETAAPAEELLEIGVRVKRKRGRPPVRISQQGSGAATIKQPLQSAPTAGVVRKRRGRSAKEAGPEVPSDVTEDDGSVSLVSVDGSLSVVSVDESMSVASVDESVSMASVEHGEISANMQTQLEKISGPDLNTGQEKNGRRTRRKSLQTRKDSGVTLPAAASKQPLHSTPKPGVVRKLRDRSAKKAALEAPSDATEEDGSVSLASVESGEISTNLETFLQNISVPDVDSDEETIPGSQIEDSLGGGEPLDEDLDSDEDFINPDGGKHEESASVVLRSEPGMKQPGLQADTQVEGVPERATRRQFKESALKRDLRLVQHPGVTVVGVFPPPARRRKRGGKQNRSRLAQDASPGGFNTSEINPNLGTADDTSISIRDNESELSQDLSVADVDERSDSIISTEDFLDSLSVQSDQSSISSFSFRTPMQKGPSRKRKKMASDDGGPEPPSTSPRVEVVESPVPVVSESVQKRRKTQLAFEQKLGVQRVGKKVVCPDCGKLVGPFYLQRHRKSDNCTKTDTKTADLSVKIDTSLVTVEGTPAQPGTSKQLVTPKQPVTPKHLVKPKQPKVLKQPKTPKQQGTSSQDKEGTPSNQGMPSTARTPSAAGTPCRKCGRVMKLHLAAHEEWCGLETVREECKNCHQQILLKKMESHLHLCRTPSPELEEDGTERKGRRAARRAMSNIHSLIKGMGMVPDSHPATPKKPRYMNPVQVTKYLKKKWEKDLAASAEIRCPLSISASHCGFVAESVAEVAAHYVICPYHKKTYKCAQCTHEATTEHQAKQHARTHTWSDGDSQDEMSDTPSVMDDEDADPDVNFSDNSDSDKNSTPRRRPGIRSTKEKKKKTSDTSHKLHFAERLEMFQDALDWTLDWRQRNQPGHLGNMAAWAPRADRWRHLPTNEASQYLPVSLSSPWFAYHAKGSDKIQTNLKRFESITKPLTLLNVGGPVWALDWLPTPIGESSTQYLAVYCHRQHDKHHSINKATSGMSAIQIWSCHTMHVTELTAAPKLSLILAQNDGAIWCLKWSPRRVWPREDETPEGRLPWLGTMAVATSNGKVNIYSIPVPGSLPPGEDDTDLPVYKAIPVLTLELQSLDNKAAMLQNCRCLDWQYLGGCHRLLAGYAGGQVALYDLLTSSPLLLTPGVGDKPHVLRPLVSFMAHGCPVTSLAFCQRRPTFFTTVSQDRQMKVWNVEHLEYPVNAVAKSEYTKVVWPLHWATIFAATDNCYCLEHNALFMIDTGYFGIQNRPLTVHNGSIMDACYSDWLNTVLSVDSSGVVEAMYLPYLMLTHKHHKSFSSRRMVMFEVQTEPLHACGCDQSANPLPPACPTQRPTCTVCHRPLPVAALPPADPAAMASMSADEEDGRHSPTLLASVKKVMRSMEVTSMPARPRTVTEMIHKYAVVFHDRCMNNLNTRKDTRIRSAKDLRADLLLPPLASQHKAEWNPNLGSHLWVAAGGEAGLLRLVHFSAFSSKREQAFVKKVFSEKEKDKQCGYTTEPL